MPALQTSPVDDYHRVAAAIRFLEVEHETPPSLDDLARHLELSPFHLQRLFQRWAGISPKRFLQALAIRRAKPLLANNTPVLDTAFAVGLSGPGRLHDLFVTLEAVTPGEFRSAGAGLNITFGAGASPFGQAVIATTARGVCGLAFCDREDEDPTIDDLRRRWPGAAWHRDDHAIADLANRIFGEPANRQPLAVLVRGTNFQVRVWEALLQVPEGATTSYTAVAAAIGRPAAIRAAASAIGDNPVAWLIPCHRVLRQSGDLGGYHWGLERKRVMLTFEAARAAHLATRL